jgi:CheY-like chemotaxis protein
MRIVIIDDEPAVAGALAEAILGQGHTATVAHSGQEGLDRIDAERPDAVFLDIKMPGLGGLDVLRAIRQGHGDLPVVLITGRANAEQLAEARRLGITGVIQKPLGLRNMQDALGALPGASARATR